MKDCGHIQECKTAVILTYTVNLPLMVKDAMTVEKWDTSANAVNKRKFLTLVAKDQEKVQ